MKLYQLLMLIVAQLSLFVYVVAARPKKPSFTSDTIKSGTPRGRSQENAGASVSDVRKRRGLFKDSSLGDIDLFDKSTVVGGLIIHPPATKKQQEMMTQR